MPIATPAPTVIINPRIYIDSEDWGMSAAKISLIPTVKRANISTFRNPDGQRPSSVSWTAEIDFVQSYGTDGLWNRLHAMALQLKTVEFAPEDIAVGVGNPWATIQIYIPPVPFVDASIGDATEWTLSEMTQGPPVFTTA